MPLEVGDLPAAVGLKQIVSRYFCLFSDALHPGSIPHDVRRKGGGP